MDALIRVIDFFFLFMISAVIAVVVIEYKLLKWNDDNICLKFLMLFSSFCVLLSLILIGVEYV